MKRVPSLGEMARGRLVRARGGLRGGDELARVAALAREVAEGEDVA